MTQRETQAGAETDTLGFDPAALREKYRVERDTRLRLDGNAQYSEVRGDLPHFIEDPYAHALTVCWPVRGCARPACRASA